VNRVNTSTQLLVPVLLPIISGLLLGFARPLRELRAQRLYTYGTTLEFTSGGALISLPEQAFGRLL